MYFKLKVVYNNNCLKFKELLDKGFPDEIEAYNEDVYAERKKAYAIKNPYAAREVPFVTFSYKDKVEQVFYTENSTCTVDNILDSIEKWIMDHSKKGIITIEQIEGSQQGRVETGQIQAFMEGVGLYLGNFSRWYHTSVVKDIDWENKIFHTLNSTYTFKINESTNH